MKKIISLILCIALCLSLTACGKSKEVKALEAQIDELGEITLDSGDDIAACEEAYDALDEKDQEQVENLGDLEDAREEYNELAAEEVSNDIAAIGTVTINSGDAIAKARRGYDALTEDAQNLVSNYSTLTAAEEEYAVAQQVLFVNFTDFPSKNPDTMEYSADKWFSDDFGRATMAILFHLQITSDKQPVTLDELNLTANYICRQGDRVDLVTGCTDGRMLYIQYWPSESRAQVCVQPMNITLVEALDLMVKYGVIDEYKAVNMSTYSAILNYLSN